MASFHSLTSDQVWSVLGLLSAEDRRAVAPTCRLWEGLVLSHHSRFTLSFHIDCLELWEDEGAVATLGLALARRPGLRELHVQALDFVWAVVSEAGVLGHFQADNLAVEPDAAELLGFAVGRMPALEFLRLLSSFRCMKFTVSPPRWLGCLHRQLRSLELAPVLSFWPGICQLTQLTHLSLNLHHEAALELPAQASALRQLAELELDSGDAIHLDSLRVLPALRALRIEDATLTDLSWVQGLPALTRLCLKHCTLFKDDQDWGDSFTAAEYCAALRSLPQLRHAQLNSLCPLASWDPPHLPHLTSLVVSWYHRRTDTDLAAEGTLRCLLAQLPSLRRLVFWEGLAADVERRVRADFPQLSFSADGFDV